MSGLSIGHSKEYSIESTLNFVKIKQRLYSVEELGYSRILKQSIFHFCLLKRQFEAVDT